MPGDPAILDDDEPVGQVLARMRRAMRLTGAQLATVVGMSQPKISRIERGVGATDPEDVGIIARALGADKNTVRALVARAERHQEKVTEWRSVASSLAERQTVVHTVELAANTVRVFDPALIPGPLQTSGYAEAVFRSLLPVAPSTPEEHTESAVLAAVPIRLRRQGGLADRTKKFHFIITEAVLRCPIVTPAVMLDQIDHLREVARSPNVSLTMTPDDRRTTMPPLHGFALLDDRMVVVDLFNTALTSRGRKDIESYRRVFDSMAADSEEVAPFLDRYEARCIAMLQRSRPVHGQD